MFIARFLLFIFIVQGQTYPTVICCCSSNLRNLRLSVAELSFFGRTGVRVKCITVSKLFSNASPFLIKATRSAGEVSKNSRCSSRHDPSRPRSILSWNNISSSLCGMSAVASSSDSIVLLLSFVAFRSSLRRATPHSGKGWCRLIAIRTISYQTWWKWTNKWKY